ncbi:DUF7696 family protein [Ralstonia syzygii subsp. celebesensis]|uniref:DUF7696 family protein n=1 Tax=Ralstonia syzygii TaxID=28097 RepID=UPI00403724B6
MQCRCPSCCADPAPTYTEQHRLECEARHVCNLPDRERRLAYLEVVAKRRGQEARDALAAEVHRQW